MVFDGYTDLSRQSALKPPDIDVVFSYDESADERIKKMLEKAAQPKNIVVVSDDKEIVFFAKAAGARPLPVEEFIMRGRKKTEDLKQDLEPKVSYSAMQKINQELRKIWLK